MAVGTHTDVSLFHLVWKSESLNLTDVANNEKFWLFYNNGEWITSI